MNRILVVLLLLGCSDSAEDQKFKFYGSQFKEWVDTALQGKEVVPGFIVMAKLQCAEAKKNANQHARKLAEHCDHDLEVMQRQPVKPGSE